jgi:hypothetical protein
MVRSNKRLALALAASPCNERSIKIKVQKDKQRSTKHTYN